VFPQANYVSTRQPISPYTTQSWFPETAANYHITPDVQQLVDAQNYNGNDNLYIGNGQGLPITYASKALLPSLNSSLQLNNVLCVPKIIKNLLFVQKFTADNSCFFEF
jgi:hypothetical protein